MPFIPKPPLIRRNKKEDTVCFSCGASLSEHLEMQEKIAELSIYAKKYYEIKRASDVLDLEKAIELIRENEIKSSIIKTMKELIEIVNSGDYSQNYIQGEINRTMYQVRRIEEGDVGHPSIRITKKIKP